MYMFWIMGSGFFSRRMIEYFKTKLSRDKNRDRELCAKEVVLSMVICSVSSIF